ncbi:MAG: M43 family zinc metalloprotease, partial [Myxococcota bacterium]
NDSPADLGQTMAHEIGHFLGLRHTTEHGGGGDPIQDTAECSDPQDGTRCPDANNFMFPFSITGVAQQDVSAGQSFVLRRSALIK